MVQYPWQTPFWPELGAHLDLRSWLYLELDPQRISSPKAKILTHHPTTQNSRGAGRCAMRVSCQRLHFLGHVGTVCQAWVAIPDIGSTCHGLLHVQVTVISEGPRGSAKLPFRKSGRNLIRSCSQISLRSVSKVDSVMRHARRPIGTAVSTTW